MSVKKKILDDMKLAMKARESDKLRVLRSLKAKLMEKEISERKGGESELTDDQAVEVLMKAAKQRKESIDQFRKGDREDLAEQEEAELKLIETYLPKMLTEAEVRVIVKSSIERTGAKGMQDMGKLMGQLMKELKGKADGSLISTIVKDELSRK